MIRKVVYNSASDERLKRFYSKALKDIPESLRNEAKSAVYPFDWNNLEPCDRSNLINAYIHLHPRVMPYYCSALDKIHDESIIAVNPPFMLQHLVADTG